MILKNSLCYFGTGLCYQTDGRTAHTQHGVNMCLCRNRMVKRNQHIKVKELYQLLQIFLKLSENGVAGVSTAVCSKLLSMAFLSLSLPTYFGPT